MSTKEAVEADLMMFQPVADVVVVLYSGSRMFGLMLLSLVSLISPIFNFVVHYDYHTFCPTQCPLTQSQAVRSLAKPDCGVLTSCRRTTNHNSNTADKAHTATCINVVIGLKIVRFYNHIAD